MNALDQTSREYWRGLLVAGGFTALPRWAAHPAMGVAEHAEMIADELVAAADKAMYRVKDSGKNGIQAAPPPTDT